MEDRELLLHFAVQVRRVKKRNREGCGGQGVIYWDTMSLTWSIVRVLNDHLCHTRFPKEYETEYTMYGPRMSHIHRAEREIP